jgi:hypothetical protein
MMNGNSMLLLTELEEFSGRLASINISLLAERAVLLGRVSFDEKLPQARREVWGTDTESPASSTPNYG